MPGMTSEHDPEITAALQESLEVAARRVHARTTRTRADLLAITVLGGGFVAVATVFAATTPDHSWRVIGTLVLLAVLHTTAHRTEFELRAGLGSMVPTEPILVAAFFLVPVHLVPLMVLCGLLLTTVRRNGAPARLRRTLAVATISGWHSIGPAVVLLVADLATPSLHHWPIYVLALFTQFASDTIVASLRCISLGIDPRKMAQPLLWTFAIDASLAPIGLAAAIAGDGKLGSVPILVAVLVLVALLAQDRRRHVESSLRLGEAIVTARGEARVDAMTGLANRRAWEEAVDVASDRLAADPNGTHVSIVLADLDHLKRTNDTLGHEAGDDLIRVLGEVFRTVAPAGATVARLGGDEFAVLLEGAPGSHDVAGLIAQLQAATRNLKPVSGAQLSASFGSGSCPPERTIRDAVRIADKAVFADKAARRASRLDRDDLVG